MFVCPPHLGNPGYHLIPERPSYDFNELLSRGTTSNLKKWRIIFLEMVRRRNEKGRGMKEPAPKEASLPAKPPVVVGGVGGSGTRAVQRILAAAGVNMGTRLNPSGDAMALMPFYGSFVPRTLAHTHGVDFDAATLPHVLRDEGIARLRACVAEHLEGNSGSDAPWGWKNPRSIFGLAYIAALFPEFRYIHVIRDGRDMAFSGNQNQVVQFFRFFFEDHDSPQVRVSPIASMRQWAKVNLEAAAWLGRRPPDLQLRVRFEDLCREPLSEVGRICAFVGRAEYTETAARMVEAPASLGRWRRQQPDVIAGLEVAGGEALAAFGYPLSTAVQQ